MATDESLAWWLAGPDAKQLIEQARRGLPAD